MIHELKTLPEYFESVQQLKKNFEVRKTDRPFEVGDFVALNEYSPDLGYTGKCMILAITYILDNPQYCKDGYAILGLSPCYLLGENATPQIRFDFREVAVYDRGRIEQDEV